VTRGRIDPARPIGDQVTKQRHRRARHRVAGTHLTFTKRPHQPRATIARAPKPLPLAATAQSTPRSRNLDFFNVLVYATMTLGLVFLGAGAISLRLVRRRSVGQLIAARQPDLVFWGLTFLALTGFELLLSRTAQ
jgi:hypothetical protein